MINLVRVELKKLFKKKSFIIVTFFLIMYIHMLCADMGPVSYNHRTLELEESRTKITALKKENETLDLNNKMDLNKYADNLSIIEIEELKNTYISNFGNDMIDEYVAHLVSEASTYKYVINDEESYNELRNEIDFLLEKIKNSDWQYFANIELKELYEELNMAQDNVTKNIYQELIYLMEYRLNNNISYYSNSELSNAIINIENIVSPYYNLKEKKILTSNEEEMLNEYSSIYLKNRYLLENKMESAFAEGKLSDLLVNFTTYFNVFIVIYIILLSGSIISEEFNKGTIKFLLTNPYKRSTILTSKILSVLLLLPIVILFMVLVVIVVGGLNLGFDSLSAPVLVFNSATGNLLVKNMFLYVFMKILFTFPFYLIITFVSILIGTLSLQTSSTYIFTFLLYSVSQFFYIMNSIPNSFIFFPFYHWDFSYLIDYAHNPYFDVSPIISLGIVGVYIAVILLIAYRRFIKIDVGNI